MALWIGKFPSIPTSHSDESDIVLIWKRGKADLALQLYILRIERAFISALEKGGGASADCANASDYGGLRGDWLLSGIHRTMQAGKISAPP